VFEMEDGNRYQSQRSNCELRVDQSTSMMIIIDPAIESDVYIGSNSHIAANLSPVDRILLATRSFRNSALLALAHWLLAVLAV
jgi:hypothetical protein